MDKTTYIHTFTRIMKTKLLLVAYILITLSCSAQNRFVKTNETCLFDDPIFEIKKEEMVFDNEKYSSILSKKKVFYTDSEQYITRIQTKKIWLTDKKTQLTKKIKYNNSNNIKHLYFYKKHSTNTKIGKEYFFDENGTITKTIDYEKGYNICWAEAISIVKKIAEKDIKKYNINVFYLSRVDLNEFPNSKPKWRVSMNGDEEYNDLDTKFYEIDGITGEFIRTYKVKTIYEE